MRIQQHLNSEQTKWLSHCSSKKMRPLAGAASLLAVIRYPIGVQPTATRLTSLGDGTRCLHAPWQLTATARTERTRAGPRNQDVGERPSALSRGCILGAEELGRPTLNMPAPGPLAVRAIHRSQFASNVCRIQKNLVIDRRDGN